MRTTLAAISLAVVVVVGTTRAQTVITRNGTIQGIKCNSTDVNSFLSIPYAEPPVGSLRFAATVPSPGSYSGTLQATTAPPACIQFGSSENESGPQSEDW